MQEENQDMVSEPQYDVIIIGGGAAGLSAAVYTTRAMLKTLVLEQQALGGQILNTGDIENYPGFPQGIGGPELAQLYAEQAERFGAIIDYDTVEKLEVDGSIKRVIGADGEYTSRAVIIGTGGEHNKLGVPGEDKFSGRGVSYCATCDGNFFRDMEVVVVGGGDAAIDEGLYLTRMTKNVTVVHRRDKLRASQILQERAFSNPKMQFIWNSTVEEIQGDGEVSQVVIKDAKSNSLSTRETQGVFIYVGFHPVSDFMRDVIEMDAAGHVRVNLEMETSVPGVFAAGDVRQLSDRQLGNAVGDGIAAALAAYRYIQAHS
jgi:thioredoxin reductase (NADPH)